VKDTPVIAVEVLELVRSNVMLCCSSRSVSFVVPRNSPGYVDELLSAARLPGDAQVAVDGKESRLIEALAEVFEITTITRPFVKAYASHCKWPDLAGLLDKGREAEFREYTYGREIIDLLLTYPPRELKRIQVRYQSLSFKALFQRLGRFRTAWGS